MRSLGPMLCTALTLAGCLVTAAPAAGATRAGVGTYDVTGVRTALDRSAVAATGAAITETDHGSVVVTASAQEM